MEAEMTHATRSVSGDSKEDILAKAQAEAEKVFGPGATATITNNPYRKDTSTPELFQTFAKDQPPYYAYVRMEEGVPPVEFTFTRPELTVALKDLGWNYAEKSVSAWMDRINYQRSGGKTTNDNGSYSYTRAELEDAMQPITGITVVKIIEKMADNRYSKILGVPQPSPEPSFTITTSALRKAIARLTGWKWGDREMVSISAHSPSELVANLIDAAKDEPYYPVGSVVKDHAGLFWQRCTGNQWLMFGSSHKSEDNVPVRPLERVDK
jgi:hypothetical protein